MQIVPNISHEFFTCASWGKPKDSNSVCKINLFETVTWDNYNSSHHLIPAFTLDNTKQKVDISNLSTKELIKELLTRFQED